MKSIKFFLLLTINIIVFGSCENNEPVINNNTEEITFSPEEIRVITEITNNSTKITEEEAMEKALDIANSFSSNSLRSGKTKTIKNSHALTVAENNGLRNDDEEAVADTVAYIFNFDNDEGYAIVSSDIRVPEDILAYTETGALGLETDNPGLAIFLEGAEDYIAESIEKAEAEKDSLIQSITEKLLAENPELAEEFSMRASSTSKVSVSGSVETTVTTTTHDWERVSGVAPLTAVEWNQLNTYTNVLIYNKYTRPKGCNGRAPYAGCVAVATAQIMAYWKYPASIDGYSMNWKEMTRYTDRYVLFDPSYSKWTNNVRNAPTNVQDNISRLMERIGAHVDMKYKCDVSSAESDKAIKWLKEIGFSGGEKHDYSFSRVKSSLDAKRIVYARGASKKKKHKLFGITYKTTYSGGHAWNYDGYLQQKQKVEKRVVVKNKKTNKITSDKTTVSYTSRDLVYVNWGWGGRNNGYYISKSFNANKGPVPSSETRSSLDDGDGGTDDNYQYKLKIWTNLRR